MSADYGSRAMADGVFPRRRPVCGKDELEHGPHEYAHDGDLADPRHCAGWTGVEAGVCVMLRQVREKMLEKNPPDGSKRFRLECGLVVYRGLLSLLTSAERLEAVFGAELLVVAAGDPGGWRLAEAPPPVAAGSVRPLPGVLILRSKEGRRLLMHEGFRRLGDHTCSTCPREIDPVDGMPPPGQRTLCSGCLRQARTMAGGPAGDEALIVGTGSHSGWKIGAMLS